MQTQNSVLVFKKIQIHPLGVAHLGFYKFNCIQTLRLFLNLIVVTCLQNFDGMEVTDDVRDERQ